MRVSSLKLVTLRDVPADAEIASHQLLIRGGYIKRVTSGIYAYMPLMWKVIKKITDIVEEEMNEIGSLQTLLPQLHPADLWKSSGRWKGYTAGEGIMFHLEDRQGRELGLGPTHEEVITTIAGEIFNSYRQLPVTLYQIQTKFRDEIRPRFGLMRSREFIMKDAYSFHANEKDLEQRYSEMASAYKKIFARCGLKTVVVEADSGAIGGAASQEFMVTAETGEDLILISPDRKYAANQEKAISIPSKAKPLKSIQHSEINSQSNADLDLLCKEQGLDRTQIIKVLAMVAITEDKKEQPLLISIRSDQELNEVKLTNVLTKLMNKEILNIFQIKQTSLESQSLENWPLSSLGPDLSDDLIKDAKTWEKKFLRLADLTASSLENFVCGANKINTFRVGISWSLIEKSTLKVDLRKAISGDYCMHDQKQILQACRGIEIGHIFQLGRKYSKVLNASFTSESGSQEAFWMGCYGIGISRLAQSAVEQSHDDSGIIWPIEIAPFEVIVVVANIQDPKQKELGEKIYKSLLDLNIDVLLDDRMERAGVKFKDADLIGIPWRIVVGRDALSGQVELFERSTKEAKLLDHEFVIKELSNEIFSKKR